MNNTELVRALRLLSEAVGAFANAVSAGEEYAAPPPPAVPQTADYAPSLPSAATPTVPVTPTPAPAQTQNLPSAPTFEVIPAPNPPAAPTSAPVSAPIQPVSPTSGPVGRQDVIDAFLALSRAKGDMSVVAVLKTAGYNRLSEAPESTYPMLVEAAIGAANG